MVEETLRMKKANRFYATLLNGKFSCSGSSLLKTLFDKY